MALRVWLPLNGDLHNQGCSNVTVTNSGATVNTSGKIGNCYYFNASSYLYENTYDWTDFNTSQFSLCCWYKQPSPVASGNSQIICIGTSSGWNNIRIGLLRRTSSGYPMFSVSNGSSAVQYNCTATTFSFDTWNHIVCTYDNGTIKIYLNGTLNKTYTTTIVPILNSSQHLGVGAASNGAEKLTGYLNDVRIYDHCLSAAEVKEISQGLVLHYKLDGFNNASMLPPQYQQLEYIESSGTSYFNTGYKFNIETDECKVIFKGNDTSNNGMIFASSGGKYFWFYYYGSSGIRIYADNGSGQQGIAGISSDLNQHTMEFKNKTYYIDGNNKGSLTNSYTDTTNNIWLFSYGNSGYPFKGRIYYTEIKKNGQYQRIFIPAKRLTDSVAGMYDLITSTFYVSSNAAFTAGTAVGTLTIQDSSGYGHNGSITGNFNLISDAPRYQTALNYSNSYIDTNIEINTTDSTICMWLNIPSLSTSYHILDARNSSGTGKQPIYTYSNGSIQTGGSSAYVNSNAGFLEANKWIFIALVQSVNNLLLYKNGNLFQTISCANTPIIKPTIGARYSHSNIYTGKMSDFRIYCTALSADDIKQLYSVSAKVDNLQNLHTFELIENQPLIKITKNGQAKCKEITETTKTSFRKDKDIYTNNLIER